MDNSQFPADAQPFRLFGVERSYFAGKVRPAFRAKRIYFEEVYPKRPDYMDLRRRTGNTLLPQVITPEDDTWQDSSEILDHLEARYPTPTLHPPTPVQWVVANLLELVADEFIALAAMHYRWSAPESEQDARAAFAAQSGEWEAPNKFADRMSERLPMLGITKASIPLLEGQYADMLAVMCRIFEDQSFLLGEQMSLGDCGLAGPMYAHLFLDLVPGQIMRNTAMPVAHWIERMNHPNPSTFTGFLPHDALHPAMSDLLKLIGEDAVPMLLDALAAIERWADDRDQTEEYTPRFIGAYTTHFRGVEMNRGLSSITLWKAQRTLDAYRGLDKTGQAAVDEVMQRNGVDQLLAYQPRHRMTRRHYQFSLSDA
ncbi:MAG: glutathione S-transferase N-terminal domain-containing protein [Pseudomonadota bacterium]